MNDLTGRRLGQYQLRAVIRRGGMSTVYLGYQPSLDRLVAIKVLAFPGDPEFAARFEREARSIAALQHPNILAVYDYGEQDDQAYLVVQYVEDGRTLVDLLREPLPPARALELMERVLAALGYAHERGVVHRDVKPSNILLPSPSWPMLADFGIAKLLQQADREPITRQGLIVGTAAYMAPEQGFGLAVDARADLYSAGVVLYELLTGRVPFKADTPMATLVAQAYHPPPPLRQANPELPWELEAVVLRALAKDPAERYQSADELAEALRPIHAALREPGHRRRARSAANGDLTQGQQDGQARAPVAPAPAQRQADVVTPPSRPVPLGVPAPAALRRLREPPAAPPGGQPQPGRELALQRLPAPQARPPAPRQRRLAVTAAALLAVGALLAGGALWAVERLRQPSESGVLLLASGNPGPAPFVGDPVPTGKLPVFVPPRQLHIQSQFGTTQELYAGTPHQAEPGCDLAALSLALRADPVRAAVWTVTLNRDPALAWSRGSRVDVGQIDAFLHDVTPVLLRHDTRFIDVGFSHGRAAERQVLLQAGSAVLIDRRGTPRVRCGSGDPLLRATAAVQRYLGTRWAGFSVGAVQAIQPGTATVRGFELRDVKGGAAFFRPAGTDGTQDR